MVSAWYATYLGVHALSVSINAGLAVWAWRNDFGRSGRYFRVALTVGLLYGLAGTPLLAARTLANADLVFPVVGAFSWASTVAWFAFVLQYTGRGHLLTRRTLAGLTGVVAVAAGIVLTNPLHGAVYAGYELVGQPYPHPEPVRGALWPVLTPLGYLIGLGSIGLLVSTTLRARNLGRRQAVLLSSIFVATILISAALRAGVRVIPPSAGGVIFNATLAYMIANERMLVVEPLTRASVMESMNDALVAVTDRELVVDYNDAALDLFPDLSEAVGDPLETAAPALAGVVDDPPEKVQVDATDGRRTLAVEVDGIERHGTRGYAVILRDVTEVEAYAADLERQTEQLDQFASVVSHDLRNPLSVARVHLEELSRRSEGDVEEAEVALESLDRMDELIEEALTLAREGRVVEDPEPVRVDAVAADAWRFVDAPGAHLETALGGMVIEADRERLQTLFENLFRNSLDHGPDDVSVCVDAVEDGFVVADDGPGIPEDLQDEVLEKGFTTSETGTGLGLSIVESIARAHGWSVSVGDSEDGGARFAFDGVRVVEAASDDPRPQAQAGDTETDLAARLSVSTEGES